MQFTQSSTAAAETPTRSSWTAPVSVLLAVSLLLSVDGQPLRGQDADDPSLQNPEETDFRSVRKLTFRGQNAEGCFSPDGSRLVVQATRAGDECDQIYTLDISSRTVQPVTEVAGRHISSYFYPDGERVLFSSTRQWGDRCPAEPGLAQGYVWPVYSTYDIYMAEPDGTDVRQLPDQLGYDGGALSSPDGSQIVYRAHHPQDPEPVADYKSLLKDGLIQPTNLQIFVMDADGSDKRQVTDNDAVNFGPYWHPSGDKIMFSLNMLDLEGRNFDLFLIDTDGTGLERVTYSEKFDSFPMFSPDGSRLVQGSNWNNAKPGETNLFIAEWVDASESTGTQVALLSTETRRDIAP